MTGGAKVGFGLSCGAVGGVIGRKGGGGGLNGDSVSSSSEIGSSVTIRVGTGCERGGTGLKEGRGVTLIGGRGLIGVSVTSSSIS